MAEPPNLTDIATRACRPARKDPEVESDLESAKEYVDEGHRSIVDSEDWEFRKLEITWSLAVGTQTQTFEQITAAAQASFPTGAVIGDFEGLVNDTSGVPVDFIDWNALERKTRSSVVASASSFPIWVAMWNRTLRYWPTLAAASTMRALVILRAAPLDDDADIPLIPGPWSMKVLSSYAAWKLREEDAGNDARAHARELAGIHAGELNAMRQVYGTANSPVLGLVEPGAFDDLPDPSAPWLGGW